MSRDDLSYKERDAVVAALRRLRHDPRDIEAGICYNLALELDAREVMYGRGTYPAWAYATRDTAMKAAVHWPLYSGSESYPVPHPMVLPNGGEDAEVVERCAADAYEQGLDQWEYSPYGDLRRQLLDFLIEYWS